MTVSAGDAPVLSLVLPAHDEADHLAAVVAAFVEALETTGDSFEVIVVDDGSSDATWQVAKELASSDERLQALRLSRNFGKEAAIAAGLDATRGQGVIVADADFQHPPALVTQLVERWRDGFLVVDGVRRSLAPARPTYRLARGLFYRLFKTLCRIDLERHSDYKLLDRRVVEAFRSMGEKALFFRGMSHWLGFERAEVEFDVPARPGGGTRWTRLGLLRLGLASMTSYSAAPLRLVSVTGAVFLLLAVLLGAQTLYGWLTGRSATGFTTVILLILMTSSMLMIALGIIGEYLAKIYEEVKARPRYVISERSGHQPPSRPALSDLLVGAVTLGAYVALAALLLLATSRWIRPLQRWVLIALLLLPLAFTGKALLFGQIYAPIDLAYNAAWLRPQSHLLPEGHQKNGILSDVHCQNIPFRKAVHYSIEHRQWPLWNPFVGAGEPLLGTAQAAPFSALTLSSLLVPLANSFTLTAALHILIAALGGFLLARELGCRDRGALLAGTAWAYSNFQVFWSGWTLGQSMALLPWVMTAARRCVTTPGWGSSALLGLTAAALVHAGHPETALHMVGVLAILLVFELTAIRRRRLWPALRTLAAGTLLGAALSAIYVLPVFDTLRQTAEWGGRAEHADIIHRADLAFAREALLADIAPFVQGFDKTGEAAHRSEFWVPGDSAYIGLLLLAPALVGCLRGRRRWLLPTLLLLGLLAGAKAPPVQPLIGYLPLFSMALNTRLVAIAALMLSIAAGLGFDRALRDGRGQRRLARVQLVTAVGAAVLIATLWRWLEQSGVASAELQRQALPFVCGPFAATVLLWLARSKRLVGALFVLLVLLTRWLEIGWFYPTLPRDVFYPPIPLLAKLPQEGPVYRVAPTAYSAIANDGALYGIEDPRVYNAIHHREAFRLAQRWSEVSSLWFNRVVDLNTPLLSFLNVEFAIMPRGHRRPPGWRRIDNDEQVRLVRNRSALARAFVPREVRLTRSSQEAYEAVRDAADLAQTAWIAPRTASEEPRFEPGVVDQPHEARVATFRDGTEYRIEADLAEESWIVVSNVDWHGWRAESDSAGRLDVARANYAFVALRVPAGSHRIRLWFRPRSFDIGLAVSALGLLGLILCAVAARRSFVHRNG